LPPANKSPLPRIYNGQKKLRAARAWGGPMNSFRRIVASVLFIAAIGCLRLAAQVTGTGSIAGNVADPSSAPVAGAEIALEDSARGVRRTAISNDLGSFLFPDLVPGVYRLRIAKDGFDGYEVTGIQLAVGQTASIHAHLKLGQVSNVLTVGAAAVLLETESNALGTVVDSKRVDELPLNGRNFLQLAVLAAGATPAVARASNSAQIGHPERFVVIGGLPSGSNSYMINGIQVRGSRSGELAIGLSPAAIDQFKVQQSFFMPDQGPNPNIVNVTTRAGTNRFHGQVFEFFRNRRLDARNYFSRQAEDLKRNQFGFNIGGPIVRNKLWFQGGYEGLREITAFVRTAFTPTQRMFGGDLSEVGRPIYDPATITASGRTPFPGAVIPANRLNPVSVNLLQYYTPGSSLTSRPNNLSAHPRNTLDEDQYYIRVDHNISEKQSLFGQFIGSSAPAVAAGLFPLTGSFFPNKTHLAMAQHTYVLGPSIVNTLRVGFSRNLAFFGNEARDQGNLAERIGVTNTFDKRGVPSQALQGYTAFGRANGDLGNIDNNYQVDEGLNWIKGKHQFRFGASLRYRRTWQQNANASANGFMNYEALFTTQLAPNAQGVLAPVANTGDSFGDFLLGTIASAGTRGLPEIQYRYTQYMPYFQDTWRLRPNLTLNYGLSWFKDTIPNPQGAAAGYPHSIDPATGLLQYAALGQISPKILKPDNNNFAPRFGFAWQIDTNTVFRAGAGVYYADSIVLEQQFGMVAPPIVRSAQINNVGRTVPEFVLGRNVFNFQPLPPLDANFAANLPPGESPFLLLSEGGVPYVSQWNASLQRMFGSAHVVELSYVGSSSHRQQNRSDFNACFPTPELGCNPATRPYPRYSGMLTSVFNGNGSYNALFARYEFRTPKSLNARMEYTFGKALTDHYEVATGIASQVVRRRALDKGHPSFDVRHRAVASMVWDLPFGRGRHWGSAIGRPLDAIAGGWSITSIATFSTGPALLIVGPNRTGSSFSDHRPNRVCQGYSGNDLRTTPRFIDAACFPIPAQGFFGNSPKAPLHGPGLNNWDIGLQKYFSFTENLRLQFRGELFNAFNHTQFGSPDVTAGGGNFGLVGTAREPRLVQLALRLLF